MPYYAVATREPLSASQKDEVAMMITDVHCGHTNAPRTFVQVSFADDLPLVDGVDLHIFASVRAGRVMEVNDGVEHDMVDRMVECTGIPLMRMDYNIYPVPASWIMEGGVILPEPGEEEEWLKKHGHAG